MPINVLKEVLSLISLPRNHIFAIRERKQMNIVFTSNFQSWKINTANFISYVFSIHRRVICSHRKNVIPAYGKSYFQKNNNNCPYKSICFGKEKDLWRLISCFSIALHWSISQSSLRGEEYHFYSFISQSSSLILSSGSIWITQRAEVHKMGMLSI